eukprot:TRINITY_DN2579_c0_g1_i4.p1 TRINITY_DN2579_c0_g1~~TRINITY_DN2579_c0_g1_i4.p1  ORF type:complete len:160 (-),score=12.60 TRINITY_DN2579_c0_g1_i4:20-499(-)
MLMISIHKVVLSTFKETGFLPTTDLANVEKMSRGEPLTDDDRRPWLERLHQLCFEKYQQGQGMVLACSSLKHAYRALLLQDIPRESVLLVNLRATFETLYSRATARQRDTGHFMPAQLLHSQLATWENASDNETIHDIDVDNLEPPQIVEMILKISNGQ